ncbi:hypothetical protein M436DRAFT_65955 [Aureobasidium namibiae CBS 147.97]|uniref:Uncharacterized protein n=1 Tax=Aureobasidium namibiae CBS 147.97 TaxID=1043004 RepID=A0A074WHR8_9PEZI|nr:uncharacterized protein M436DRAFT_65955 [Aureobasidium namibiae CBS 147.97]KEQ71159.1 hypothetical protein M436DRAFT_65955 [Aureobasidium namibiae CBS 147.97]
MLRVSTSDDQVDRVSVFRYDVAANKHFREASIGGVRSPAFKHSQPATSDSSMLDHVSNTRRQQDVKSRLMVVNDQLCKKPTSRIRKDKVEAFARFSHFLYTRTHRAIAVPHRHMIWIVAEEMHTRVGKLQGSGATERISFNSAVAFGQWSTVISGEKFVQNAIGEAQYKHNGVYEMRLSEEGGTPACVYELSLLICMSCCDLSGIHGSSMTQQPRSLCCAKMGLGVSGRVGNAQRANKQLLLESKDG